MCVWNHRHPDDRVYFFGFDMQQPDDDAPALRAYLERVGLPADDPRVQGIERCSQSPWDWGREPYQDDDYQECVKRLDQLARFFDRREANLVRRTSREEFELARIHLVGFRAWQDELYYWPSPTESYRAGVARDEAMAWIFAALRDLRFPGIKTVIWAHNFHIEEDAATSFGYPSMGTYLAEALGDHYITLGLIGYRVEIDWPGVGCGLDDAYLWDNALELLLHDLGEPYLFVDLDFRGSDRPFLQPGRRYQVGGRGVMVPRDHYDGFFFLDHSEAMIPVNREPCR